MLNSNAVGRARAPMWEPNVGGLITDAGTFFIAGIALDPTGVVAAVSKISAVADPRRLAL